MSGDALAEGTASSVCGWDERVLTLRMSSAAGAPFRPQTQRRIPPAVGITPEAARKAFQDPVELPAEPESIPPTIEKGPQAAKLAPARPGNVRVTFRNLPY